MFYLKPNLFRLHWAWRFIIEERYPSVEAEGEYYVWKIQLVQFFPDKKKRTNGDDYIRHLKKQRGGSFKLWIILANVNFTVFKHLETG